MFYWAYGCGVAAVLLNIYIIVSYIRCGFGKYPPFIGSFGRARREVLVQAEKYLRQAAPGTKVVDLGCGCGNLLLPLAAKFSQHQFIGLEWDAFAYLLMRRQCRKFKNVRVQYGDFMRENWGIFDLVLCYIGNDIAPAVSAKLAREAKPGAVVISEGFALPGLPKAAEISAPTLGMPLKVFVYTLKE